MRLAAGTCALFVLSGGIAPALDDSRQTSSYTLTQTRPASSTGEHFKFDYVNPADPEAKPPAVTKVTTVLPRGAVYDPAVPGSCAASDAELTLMGAAACPPDSAIGGGVVTVDTGLQGPARVVTADVEFFNNADDPDGEFIYINTVRGTQARTIIRADATGGETTTNTPFLPGTPPDGGAIDTVDLHVLAISRTIDGVERHYITTPSRCPRSRRWITKVRFGYGDGVNQTVATANRCKRPTRRRAR